MSQPAPDPISPTVAAAVRDLVVGGVRRRGIDREWAVPLLEVIGLRSVDVEELVHAAEEAGQ